MTIDVIEPSILLPTKRELLGLFPVETAAFIGSTLARRELQNGIDIGITWGIVANRYLQGIDDRTQRIDFYTGHIGDEKTRAAHILNHYGFTQYLLDREEVTYDLLNERYIPSSQADKKPSTAISEIALYRVEDHHDLDGVAGRVSYLSPDFKQTFDENKLAIDDPAVIRAERLIAEA